MGIQLKRQFSIVEITVLELLECSLTIFFSFKLYYSAASALTLFVLENVNSDDIASSTHMVFQVFPLGFVAEVRQVKSTTFHTSLVLLKVLLVKHLASDHLALCKLTRIVLRILSGMLLTLGSMVHLSVLSVVMLFPGKGPTSASLVFSADFVKRLV